MITKISDEVTQIDFQNFGSIVYLLQIKNQKSKIKNILIDTSSKTNEKELINSLSKLKINPEEIEIIILTHGHYDHIENIDLFQNAKIYGNFTKKINADHSQTLESKIIPISQLKEKIPEIKIIEAPGHTDGDILILYKNILFSGDVIFHNGYIGRNDFPESDIEKQKISLHNLSKLKFDILCPGH